MILLVALGFLLLVLILVNKRTRRSRASFSKYDALNASVQENA